MLQYTSRKSHLTMFHKAQTHKTIGLPVNFRLKTNCRALRAESTMNPTQMHGFHLSCVPGGTPDPSHESGPQRDSPEIREINKNLVNMQYSILHEKRIDERELYPWTVLLDEPLRGSWI